MRRGRIARAARLAVGAVVLLLAAAGADAKVWTVNIQGLEFVPGSVSIAQGDSVRWVNLDSVSHTSTSDTGIWTSQTLVHNASYTRKFPDTGQFPYHCSIHVGMQATVTVTAVQTSRETWGRIKRLYEDR